MKDQFQKFYLVRHDVLPEAMRKTIEAKQLIENGTAQTIHDAVQKVDLSRSAYYKYKEAVYPFKTIVKEQIITLFFYIEDRTGTLSKLLKIVAESGCNILTIHQTIPIQGKANVTLSLDISALQQELDTLIQTLKQLEFVERVDMLGSGT